MGIEMEFLLKLSLLCSTSLSPAIRSLDSCAPNAEDVGDDGDTVTSVDCVLGLVGFVLDVSGSSVMYSVPSGVSTTIVSLFGVRTAPRSDACNFLSSFLPRNK